MDRTVRIALGRRVSLRPFRPSDAAGLREAVVESGTDLSRFETWASRPFTIEKASEYVHWWVHAWIDESAFFFAIVDSKEIVGACGLFAIRDDRSASIGYWVRSSRTGAGIATDAARAVAAWAFDALDVASIDLRVSNSNGASIRVAEKVGAVRVGDLDGGLPLGSRDAPASIYILRTDAAESNVPS